MKKIFLFAAIILSLSISAQNKITIVNNALNRVDSNIYVPHYQLDTAKVNLRSSIATKLNISDTAAMFSAHPKMDTLYRTVGKDSLQYTINGRYHAILDSAGGGGVTTAQDTTYRTIGKDSIQFTIGGRYHAILDSTISANQATSSLGVTLDGQGGIVTTGSKGFVTIPYSCTITNWYVSADVSGTIQFDIKRSGTSIVGAGNKPALSSAISGNAAAASWTSVTVTAGDILEWVVDSSPAPASITNVSLVLKVTK